MLLCVCSGLGLRPCLVFAAVACDILGVSHIVQRQQQQDMHDQTGTTGHKLRVVRDCIQHTPYRIVSSNLRKIHQTRHNETADSAGNRFRPRADREKRVPVQCATNTRRELTLQQQESNFRECWREKERTQLEKGESSGGRVGVESCTGHPAAAALAAEAAS